MRRGWSVLWMAMPVISRCIGTQLFILQPGAMIRRAGTITNGAPIEPERSTAALFPALNREQSFPFGVHCHVRGGCSRPVSFALGHTTRK